MAAFGTVGGRGAGRGSPGFRFTLYALLSVIAMYLDQRQHYLEPVRYMLQAAAYPLQLAVNSPPAAWRWISESLQTRDALRVENARLRSAQRDLELRAMRYEALARENGELRGLREALPPVADRWLAAEVVSIQLSSLRQRLLLNRGAANGVFKGQAVLDDKGLIGQTIHVGPWSAEVILITDPEHAVPVLIERTGLRTIAVGAADTTSLALPYLPANADIKSGDLLVTSGLGGVFPEGYPVARVTEVHRDAVQPLAQVRAAPLAHLDTDSEVMLVWFRADHPAAPAPQTSAAARDLKVGNAALQPQPAPPKPRAAPAPPAQPAAAHAAPAPAAASAPPARAPAATAPQSKPPPEAPATAPESTTAPPAESPPATPVAPEQSAPPPTSPPPTSPPPTSPPQTSPPQTPPDRGQP
ncbi:MAG TPA: rod shape-determining protein MreC [Steroidobacteraceae bacterium]|nr:rod shape-determining protein MreC [Steroidobacteraceae bacterium]